MRQLVLIHGRAQQGKDSVDLKREWLAALGKGLGKSNLTLPIAEDAVRFPYYGDTLEALLDGASEDQAAAVVVRGAPPDAEQKEFICSLMEEIRERAGITEDDVREVANSDSDAVARGPLNWEWAQGILRAIDRHVPGASGTSVALFTNDVYQYLKNPGVCDVIDTGVRMAFTPGVPAVVVGHSLGCVVSYKVLRHDGRKEGWNVPLYVTVGAPLAVTTIKKSLNALGPIRHPECARSWFNAMDERDVVALYPLDAKNFDVDPAIVNKTDVRNDTSNRHGIRGYLDDKEVARRIYDALVVS